MSDVTLRAQVLAEALPYIQKYYGKTIVRKCQEKTERLFDFFSAPEKHRSFLVYPKHWSPPVFTIDQK